MTFHRACLLLCLSAVLVCAPLAPGLFSGLSWAQPSAAAPANGNAFDQASAQLEQGATMLEQAIRAGKQVEVLQLTRDTIAPNSPYDVTNRIGGAIMFLRAYARTHESFTPDQRSQAAEIAQWLFDREFPIAHFMLELFAMQALIDYVTQAEDEALLAALVARPASASEILLPVMATTRTALGAYFYAVGGQSALAKSYVTRFSEALSRDNWRVMAERLRSELGLALSDVAVDQMATAAVQGVERAEFARAIAMLELALARLLEDGELASEGWRRLEAAYAQQPAATVEDFMALSMAAQLLNRTDRSDEAEAANALLSDLISGDRLFRIGFGRKLLFSACSTFYNSDLSRLEIDASAIARFDSCESFLKSEDMPDVFWWRLKRALFLERAGRLHEAKRAYEAEVGEAEFARGMLPIEQRLYIQEAYWREGYAGLLRTTAKIAAQTKSRDAFIDAIFASEQARARTFSERLGNLAPVRRQDIESFLTRLKPGEVALFHHSLRGEQIVLAASPTDHRVAIIPYSEAALNTRMTALHARLSNADTDVSALEADLLALSREFYSSAANLMKGARQVIVMSDGPVAAIPFTLLSTNANAYQPLLLQAEVSYSPSVRVAIQPAAPERLGGTFFGIGDPRFPAITGPAWLSPDQQRTVVPASAAIERSGGALALSPLPETFEEVLAARRALGVGGEVLLGHEASEAAVKGADFSKARVIHFATHGLLAGDIPWLREPALALTPSKEEDGWLTASEISALRLQAEITVLSACNTGAGRSVVGEGVIGLSRAFLLAGSQSVLASLWPVNSRVTVDFMDAFYAQLANGANPAVSLRNASAQIREKYPHPKHWAPFILVSKRP